MTPLPHNPAITVIDLPEDDKPMGIIVTDHSVVLETEEDLYRLPPGTYKLICLGLQATEQEAREIVENLGYSMYPDYESNNPYLMYNTATASLRSLITSNGWKNPVFLRKEK